VDQDNLSQCDHLPAPRVSDLQVGRFGRRRSAGGMPPADRRSGAQTGDFSNGTFGEITLGTHKRARSSWAPQVQCNKGKVREVLSPSLGASASFMRLIPSITVNARFVPAILAREQTQDAARRLCWHSRLCWHRSDKMAAHMSRRRSEHPLPHTGSGEDRHDYGSGRIEKRARWSGYRGQRQASPYPEKVAAAFLGFRGWAARNGATVSPLSG